MADIETDALLGSGGTPQPTTANMDDQGSEDAERSLSLDLAAQERRMLREIEEALRRIDSGNYGICELTGRAIRKERLEAVPWTRYSIDAARELERRPLRS
ncbi:MAG: TraR/DksA C4-type zinc finger protein [Phycisphaeraceae bacterium]|nr:TraR/DksA C4-type zinc finger protein [Phycisphaeraceae bacterium]